MPARRRRTRRKGGRGPRRLRRGGSCRHRQLGLGDLQLGSDAARALGEASRGLRERIRDALTRIAVGAPSPGADATAAQAVSASSLKVASVCAGVAASACLAAGAVPGIGGVGPLGQQSHAKEPPTKSTQHLVPPSARPTTLIDSLPRFSSATPPKGEPSPSRFDRTPKAKHHAAEQSTSTTDPAPPKEARVSGRQVGTEVGAESGGQHLSTTPASGPLNSPNSSSSGDATAESGQNTSSESSDASQAEFGM